MAQAGLPGYEASNGYGIYAPAATPQAPVYRQSRAIIAIMNEVGVKQLLEHSGLEIFTAAPDAFAAYLKNEMVKWRAIVKPRGSKQNKRWVSLALNPSYAGWIVSRMG